LTIFDVASGIAVIAVAISVWSYYVIGVNWAFRLAEGASVGVTVGFAIVTQLQQFYSLGYLKLFAGQYSAIIWTLVGLLGILRIFPKYTLYSRPASALIWGMTAGVLLTLQTQNNLNTFVQWAMNDLSKLETWCIFVALFTVSCYFMFTAKFSLHEKRTMGVIPKIGRYLALFYFGEQTASIAFKRVTYAVAVVNQIRSILQSFGIPV